MYSAVPHGGAEWLRYTASCRLPKKKIPVKCFVGFHIDKMCQENILQIKICGSYVTNNWPAYYVM